MCRLFMKIKKYTEKDFEVDFYNIIMLLSEETKKRAYVKRAAFYLMNRFIKNKEWILAEKMREIVKDFNNEGPI